MRDLLKQLFSESETQAILSLCSEPDQTLLSQAIGKKILDSPEIIDTMPLQQLMFITSLSPFADDLNECHAVARILFWGIKRIEILPMRSEQPDQEFAYKCLISLSLYKQALIRRKERYGSPDPGFYRAEGRKSFLRIGMTEIGYHFPKWELFLNEMMV